jgi:HSP20 family molecular chaperone IbpA
MTVETPELQNGNDVGSPELTRRGPYFRPNVDILELPEELVVKADMPGTNGDSIDIHFEDGSLTIHGRVPERQVENHVYLQSEYRVGDFYRTFHISEDIDVSRISAEYTNGVLTLHLPKVEEVKPRKIKVSAK